MSNEEFERKFKEGEAKTITIGAVPIVIVLAFSSLNFLSNSSDLIKTSTHC